MYATKRRRRNVKSLKSVPKDPPAKSNPSKRHRERLNTELEMLASLLPFEQSVVAKLDKLSILRLAVSYLRTKSYFSAVMNEKYECDYQLHRRLHQRIHSQHVYTQLPFTDTSTVLQALSGFLFVVTCDGEVFYASHTVEQYLGFHQSDIIHQSALELIHSEDREAFKSHLDWKSQLTTDVTDMTLEQIQQTENCHLLQRCFTARFRCLLDNASGFITLEISGRIKTLMGQNTRGKPAPLALFALCCPFGPLPLPDVPWKDYTFKTKHRMDLSIISIDPRGKQLFQFSDREMAEKGGYDLLHPDDLNYYSAAHQELMKTGSAGLIAYRLMTKDLEWVWLQTSARVIYKNSKPELVLATHRHLTDDEGQDLCRKRGSEFKLPYPIVDVNQADFDNTILLSPTVEDIKPNNNKKTNNKTTQSRNENRKQRKTQHKFNNNNNNNNNNIVLSNSYQLVNDCNQLSVDFKPDVLHSACRTATFDSEFYRTAAAAAAAGYQTAVLTGCVDPLYSRYYHDSSGTGTGGQEVSSYPAMCNTHSAADIPGYDRVNGVIRSRGDVGFDIYSSSRYHNDKTSSWFDNTTGTERLELMGVGGLLDPCSWFGPTAAAATASWCDHPPGTAAASLSSYYQRHRGLNSLDRPLTTAARYQQINTDSTYSSVDTNSKLNYNHIIVPAVVPPTPVVPLAVPRSAVPTVVPRGLQVSPTDLASYSQQSGNYYRYQLQTDTLNRMSETSDIRLAVTVNSCSSLAVATPVIQTTGKTRALKNSTADGRTMTSPMCDVTSPLCAGIAVPVVKSTSSWMENSSNNWTLPAAGVVHYPTVVPCGNELSVYQTNGLLGSGGGAGQFSGSRAINVNAHKLVGYGETW